MIFNLHIFEADAVDTMRTPDALSTTEHQHAQDIVNDVYTSSGVPLQLGMDLETANPDKVGDSVKTCSSKFAALQSGVSGVPGMRTSNPGQWVELKQGDGRTCLEEISNAQNGWIGPRFGTRICRVLRGQISGFSCPPLTFH